MTGWGDGVRYGVNGVDVNETRSRAHDETHEPINPQIRHHVTPSGNDVENDLWHQQQCEQRTGNEVEPRSERAKHGHERAPKELSHQGAENEVQKMSPGRVLRCVPDVTEHHCREDGPQGYVHWEGGDEQQPQMMKHPPHGLQTRDAPASSQGRPAEVARCAHAPRTSVQLVFQNGGREQHGHRPQRRQHGHCPGVDWCPIRQTCERTRPGVTADLVPPPALSPPKYDRGGGGNKSASGFGPLTHVRNGVKQTMIWQGKIRTVSATISKILEVVRYNLRIYFPIWFFMVRPAASRFGPPSPFLSGIWVRVRVRDQIRRGETKSDWAFHLVYSTRTGFKL